MLRYKNLLKNKEGQIGETTTWIIATLVIIGILLIFIYVSFIMSKIKMIDLSQIKLPGTESRQTGGDFLSQKTSFAHQLAGNKNKEAIDKALEKPPEQEKNIVQQILGT
jgi:hypothetical protein